MFNRIAIIGIGLIGSSLALACKKAEIASKIVGCSSTKATLNTGLELNIIDEAFTNPGEAVENADITILCTPLSTYGAITADISPHLKNGSIFTDAGSVKHEPTTIILDALRHEQKTFFVPAHPIAGTEKSGPEAGFAELYQGKKTILTPLPITNKNAVKKVKFLWESVGSHVEFLDMRRHDFIYATVSHDIQFLTSCFGLALLESGADIEKYADINFRKFIRLTGSDSVMWRDIFLLNSSNISVTIDAFRQNLFSFEENLIFDEVDSIKHRLENSQKKRLYLHKLLKNHDYTEFRKPDYSELSTKERVWIDVVPRIISAIIIEGLAESEYAYASGAGMHGFTKNIILDGSSEIDDIFSVKEETIKAIRLFIEKIDLMKIAVIKRDIDVLNDLLNKAKQIYQKLY